MDKSIERIDQLVELWLDGSTTEACSEALPARLMWVATAFEGYGALAEERNPQPVKRQQRARRQLIRPLQHVVQWGLAAAAMVAMVIAISIDREPYCYINGTAIHDAQLAMNETACFEHLAELDEAMSVLSMFENS